jgi:O-antigen ligase
MEILLTCLFGSLLLGQLGAITVLPGVTVYVHDALVVISLVVGVISLIQNKKCIKPALLIPTLTFIGIGILSLLVNLFRFSLPQIGVASLYLLRFAVYACLYFVLVSHGRISSKFLLSRLFWFGIGISLIGFIQYIWYPELRNLSYLGWDPHYLRLFSTLLDPNFAGIIIVLTFILGIYLWQQKYSRLIVFAEVLNLIALYLTFSRSSYLAFVAAILVLIIYKRQWKILLLLLLFVVIIVFLPKPGGHTLLLTRVDSTFARIGNWEESIGIITKAPIIGNGFNTLRFVYERNHPELVEGPLSKAAAGLDSSLLFILATTGIIGFAIYMWILLSSLKLFWKHKQLVNTRGIMIAVLVALLTHSLFTNSLFYPWVMLWFWIFIAAEELDISKVISDT